MLSHSAQPDLQNFTVNFMLLWARHLFLLKVKHRGNVILLGKINFLCYASLSRLKEHGAELRKVRDCVRILTCRHVS